MKLLESIQTIIAAIPKSAKRNLIIAGLVSLVTFLGIFALVFDAINTDQISVLGDRSYILNFLDNDGVVQSLNVAVADTDEERSKGLMDITYLPENQGMLFVFPDNYAPTMWMKNTYIPLDMIFLSEDFKVLKIFANTTPIQTSETYSSDSPAKFVLEVNGGVAQKFGIEEGEYFLTPTWYK